MPSPDERDSKNSMKPLELLAPAGNLEKLKFAIEYGADAVYLGGKAFGLRAYGGNFDTVEMAEGIQFAHERGKKVYVTVNIMAHNRDLPELPDYLKSLDQLGVDALIISDPGVFMLAKEYAPHTELHVSTQANTTNWSAARFWQQQGASRIVLARELSLDETKEIHEKTGIEIESFVHGAMCISYSGRCLLSNYFSETRDSNRGECIQACRYKYSVVEEARPGEYWPVEEDERGTYIFNSKDLCLLPLIPKMVEAGITSFKIEGRMKSAHYVATVTGVYRSALDAYLREGDDYYVRPEWYQELEKISHRPYTTGFAVGRPSEQDQIYGSSSNVQSHEFIGLVLEYDEATQTALIEQRNHFAVGELVEFRTPEGNVFTQKIEQMTDGEGEAISRAPHPRMLVRLPMQQAVTKHSLMRRQIHA